MSLTFQVKQARTEVSTGLNVWLTGIQKALTLVMGKSLEVVAGPAAATTGTKIILPVPDRLDDEGTLVYLGKAFHEASHNTECSDFEHFKNIQVTHEHGHLIARMINIADDIRCENQFQARYPRVVKTTLPYWQWKDKNILPPLNQALDMDNLVGVVMNLGVLFIARCRARHLRFDLTYQPLPGIEELYKKFFADLEDEAESQVEYQDAVELAMKLYERIKDMIKEDKDNDSNNGDSSEDESEDESSEGGSGSENIGEPEDSGSDEDEPSGGQEDDDSEGSDTSSAGAGEGDSDDSADESGEESSDGSEESQDEGEDPSDEGSEDASLGQATEGASIDRYLEALDEEAEDIKTTDDLISSMINQMGKSGDEYHKDSSVKDNIEKSMEGSVSMALEIKSRGLQLLGKNGRDMIRHFISQTKPRTLRRQDSGRFDVRTFTKNKYTTDVYNRKIKGSLERAALAIALDNSASMKGPNSLIASQVLSGVLALADKAGIPTLAAGYTIPPAMPEDAERYKAAKSYREYPIRIDVIKRFEERYNASVMRRCVPLPDWIRGGTPDLDCVRWITPQLWARPETNKILFVICDGQPTAWGPELTIKLRVSYRKYLDQCKLAGIKVFGLGIQANLQEYFGDDWSLVTPESLGDMFIERLRGVLSR